MNKQLFILVVISIAIVNCKTSKCRFSNQFPLGFSKAWIADSLCNQHFRLHQRKVFFPNQNIEQRIKLEGATERCILAFFGKPYKVIEEKDGRGTRGFVYLMNIDSVDKTGAFDQGTFLRIYIRGEVVVKYSIFIT